jgi:hypothetical protein
MAVDGLGERLAPQEIDAAGRCVERDSDADALLEQIRLRDAGESERGDTVGRRVTRLVPAAAYGEYRREARREQGKRGQSQPGDDV